MNSLCDPSSSTGGRSTPSKLFISLRPLFSHRQKLRDDEDMLDQPTPSRARARYRADDADTDASATPSIEQIAMGLHISHTPHIPAHLAHLHLHVAAASRPASAASPSHPHAPPRRRFSHSHAHTHSATYLCPASVPPTRTRHAHRHSSVPLPPPPARSALKKPRAGSPPAPAGSERSKSGSLTTLDSAASVSTAASSSAPPTPQSARTLFGRLWARGRGASVVSASEPELATPRKAVRFEVGGAEAREEQGEGEEERTPRIA